MKKMQTTDGRFTMVAPNVWWDTSGVDLVPGKIVDDYLRDNPAVGIMVEEGRD